MAKTKMNLFRKVVKTEQGVNFDTFFLKYPNENISISCKLTNDCKKAIAKSGADFPLEIELTDNEDYFITQEKYQDKDDIERLKDIVVIQKFTGLRHLEIQGLTLNDILAKHKQD